MGDSGGPRGVPETRMLCPLPGLSTGTQENQSDSLSVTIVRKDGHYGPTWRSRPIVYAPYSPSWWRQATQRAGRQTSVVSQAATKTTRA